VPDACARRREVGVEVSALCRSWREGPSGDAALRARCQARLEALRGLWRAEPALFGEEEIAALKELSAALKAPPPAPRPVAQAVPPGPCLEARAMPPGPRPEARAVLRELFGHAAFRPGQEPIIEAVLAGRDCIGVMPTGRASRSPTSSRPASSAEPRSWCRPSSPS